MNTGYSVQAIVLLFGLSTVSLLSINAFAQQQELVNGTTGTPLGGFGAGAVKYNASNGTFALMSRPPADAYDFKQVKNARFQLFTKKGTTVTYADTLIAVKTADGNPDDDAIWPQHAVNFGRTNGLQLKLLAFSPLDNSDYNAMSLPYAFYEFTVTNQGDTPVGMGLALQWDAGKHPFSYVLNRGLANKDCAIFVSNITSLVHLTAGDSNDPLFRQTGKCNGLVETMVAKVALSTSLQPGEQRKLSFVLAWYERDDPELAYYFNLYPDAAKIAEAGTDRFQQLKRNAETFTKRFRAANLPGWLKNVTQNTLSNLSTNSMYKKDGRVAFAEGQWTCFGTMDQMWHARQIISQYLPYFAWQELLYWARTQMHNGQIHHDFNKMDTGTQREQRSVLVGWDDTEHQDYRDIQKWVDLNCALIISTYETYQMTADKRQFDVMWPYLKKAGQRIFDQVGLYGSKQYPFTFDNSENSYDAGGNPNPFNASLSAVAYKIMLRLAKENGEPKLANKYAAAYAQVVRSYRNRYLNDTGFIAGNHSESFFAGQWLALHLKLGEVWSAAETDFVPAKLDQFYHPYYWGLENEKGTYDEWTPYLLTHYGGLLLNTNRSSQWEALQIDAYQRQYGDKNKIFDHPLNILPKVLTNRSVAKNISSDKQYISLPAIWRNYYDLIGFYRDRRTKELWLKPVLPKSLNNQLVDALFLPPEGAGTITCQETGKFKQNKELLIKTDSVISVSTLYLADNLGKNVTVQINNKKFPFKRVGTGYQKELAVAWNGKVDHTGVKVMVSGDPGDAPPALPSPPKTTRRELAAGVSRINAFKTIEAEQADKLIGVERVSFPLVGGYIQSCNNFDYIQFNNVDFGKEGAKIFFARVAGLKKGSVIEVVLDGVAGEIVGTCTVPDGSGPDQWAVVSCLLRKAKGVHDVVLKFSGSSADDLFHFDKLTFRSDPESAAAEAFK